MTTKTRPSAAADLDSIPVVPPNTAEFETTKFVIRALLEKALVVLPTRDIAGSVLKNYQIEVQNTDPPRLQIAATDLDLWAIASTPLVTVKTPGSFVLPGTKLNEIADSADEGDFSVSAKNGVCTISVKRTKWELRMPDASDYPPFPEAEDIKFYSVDRAKFVSALGSVRRAVSTEALRPNLMRVDIVSPNGKGDAGRMRASDSVRYHEVSLPEWPKGLDTHIPTSAADVLLKLLRTTQVATIEIGDADVQVVFRIGGDVFVASKLNGDFPDVDSMIVAPAMSNRDRLSVAREDLDRAIRRVRVTADDKTSAVALTLSSDKVEVSSQDKNGNTAVEELDASWTSTDRTVAFNHKHLTDMIRSVDSPTCEFLLGKDSARRKSPLLLNDESSGTIVVLNQQRLDWA